MKGAQVEFKQLFLGEATRGSTYHWVMVMQEGILRNDAITVYSHAVHFQCLDSAFKFVVLALQRIDVCMCFDDKFCDGVRAFAAQIIFLEMFEAVQAGDRMNHQELRVSLFGLKRRELYSVGRGGRRGIHESHIRNGAVIGGHGQGGVLDVNAVKK